MDHHHSILIRHVWLDLHELTLRLLGHANEVLGIYLGTPYARALFVIYFLAFRIDKLRCLAEDVYWLRESFHGYLFPVLTEEGRQLGFNRLGELRCPFLVPVVQMVF